MNKTYRSIWNATTNTWTAAAETARSHSKGSARIARAALIAFALGGAAIGNAAAADACTTADGSSGSLDGAGVCKAAGGSISTMGTIGTMAAIDDTYIKINTTGAAAVASGGNGIAIGGATTASGTNAVAVGGASTASQMNSSAFGQSAHATGAAATALGMSAVASQSHATALGVGSNALGVNSTAIGVGTSASGTGSIAIGEAANSSADGAVALGAGSTADRANSISVGATGTKRQIVNVADATQSNDAVNLGQMNTALATKVDDTYVKIDTSSGTGAAVAGASSIAVGAAASASNTYATAFGNKAMATGSNATAIGFSATGSGGASVAVGGMSVSSGTHSVALGDSAIASHNESVALGFGSQTDRTNSVSVGTTALRRQITNVADGTQDNDAVNLGQLNTGLSTTNASISTVASGLSTTNVALSTANTTLTSLGAEVSTAKDTIAAHTSDISTINDQLNELSNGTVGLVQQAGAGADLTVGANTDGDAVNFAGKTNDRKLTGIAAGDVSATSNEAVNGAGDVSATSNEAVNGSQLHGASESVAAAIGGGSTVNADGSISAPSFTVGDGSGGTTTVGSVADAVSNLDGRTTTNEGQITKLADQIGSGTVGLVQQAGAGADLTVGANTDGDAVNFTGTAGARKLTGIAAGDVSAASNEAVNGSQLHGASESVAAAIGGGSTVNADGSISAPSFTVGDGSGGTTTVSTVGGAISNLDGRTTTNEGQISKLADQIGSGTVGLVQQNPADGSITVGASSGGSVVNFAGNGGPRVLSGVANGVADDDVVTVSQLRATGLIDYTGKEVGAVTYDSGLSFDSVTFAGTNGTKLRQVAAGEISATSMEAVNGSQLFDLQEQFAQQYSDLSSRYGDLSGRIGDLEAGGGSGGGSGGTGSGGEGSMFVGDGAVASGENSSAIGQGSLASGENASAVGQGAVASGSNSSAVGQGSVASGSNSSAVGQGSVASGSNSSAVGQGAVASGENSSAFGQGASATGSSSVAIGQGSVATEANTVSFGSEGNERRLVNVADGINATDAATKGQLDRAMESVDQRFNDTNRAINDVAKNAYAGIAAAMAMPNMTPSQPGKTVVALGAANFKSGSAVAAGATYRSRNGKWLVNGAASVTSVGDAGVRAQVGYEF